VGVPREAVSELRAKYAEMLAMRLADGHGGRGDRPARDDPRRVRARMQRLADKFPGALREIDDLPLGEIRRRVAALDAVLAGDREAEPWMEAVALFHTFTRGILVAKRWLGRRKRVDEALRLRFERELGELPFPEDSRGWAAHLETVASPPRGRLLDVVFARIGRALGLPAAVVRALVFPGPSR
jgi:hypothetical protein